VPATRRPDLIPANVAVFGANGQLGRAFIAALGDAAQGLDRNDCDLADGHAIAPVLDRLRPSLVINAAAWTAVDDAESAREAAMRVNAEAPGHIARWCAHHQVPLVHFSTDYVFAGSGTRPWRETDPTAPCNAYGHSKLAGERRIAAEDGRYLIFRTSWVYARRGRNFLTAMQALARSQDTLDVVADQIGAPTYAPSLARAVLRILDRIGGEARFPAGIYHLCGGGETSWYGFASAIFTTCRRRPHLNPIASDARPTPARRPHNSRLAQDRVARRFGIALPHWRDDLDKALSAPPDT